MSLIKVEELRQMDDKTLSNKLEELRKELIKINAKVAIGTAIENPGKIKEIKKTIAKILTISNEKKSKKYVEKVSHEKIKKVKEVKKKHD